MKLEYITREPHQITAETPILFLIHGYGSNEEDLFSFKEDLPDNFLIISLKAPINLPFSGHAWYDIDFVNAEKFINVYQAQSSIEAILDTIEEVRGKYGITEGKNHLIGFSQGGILSYALSLTYPEKFQKVACLSAYPEEKILTEIVGDRKKLEHLRFFISHGTEDSVIPLDWGRKGADKLYDLSCYFTFREYASGHGVKQKNYHDLMDFFYK